MMVKQLQPSLTTQSVLSATGQPLHLLPSDQLGDQRISSVSAWRDSRWTLDNLTRGARGSNSAIAWDHDLPDGTNLTDAVNDDLLDWLKRLIWSAYAAPGDGAAPLKPGSLGQKSTGLRWTVSWLVTHHVRWPVEITPSVIRQVVDDLRSEAEDSDEDEPGGLTEGIVWGRLAFFIMVWQQRFALERAGIKSMPKHPFGHLGATSVAKSVGAARHGQFQPLPDEVAIPLLNRACELLGAPAQDVLQLQRQCSEAYEDVPVASYPNGRGTSVARRVIRQRKAALRFRFSAIGGSPSPWHPSLEKYFEFNDTAPPMRRVRALVVAIQTAAVTTIQATTGMRISEICALRAGISRESGLPIDVTVETSLSGLEEVFVLRSSLSKSEETPRGVTWTLGSRSAGSEYCPPAVQALLILNELLSPYRALLNTRDLLLSFNTKTGLPKTAKGTVRITGDRLRHHLKTFIAEWVDLTALPDESRRKVADYDLVPYRESQGRCIKTHQLRKLFANFTLRVDQSLLPALQMHFHHVSQAMTDGGYRMSDPALLREVDDVRKQQSARLMLELLQHPDKQLAGHYGEQIASRLRKELAPQLAGQPTKKQFIEVYSWVDDNQLAWHFEPHGICGAVAASEMDCHREGDSEHIARWRPQLRPNYATRTPTMCAGCRSVIMSDVHLPFWENRYIETQASLLHYRRSGLATDNDERALKLETQRANQARSICKKLGADLDQLEGAVERRIEEMNDA